MGSALSRSLPFISLFFEKKNLSLEAVTHWSQTRWNYGIKIGDTLEDIHEGKSVGATVIAVSSGTQSIDTLVKGNPKVVLPSVAAVPLYLENHGYLG